MIRLLLGASTLQRLVLVRALFLDELAAIGCCDDRVDQVLQDDADRADGVVVPRDDEVDLVGVAVGVHDGDDLDPQLATNYEIGLKGNLGDKTRVEVAVFQIDVEDELVPFELATQPGRDFFENAGSSSRRGAEFSVISQPFQGLRATLAYTYSDFTFDDFIDDNGNDFSGLQLPGIPKNLLNVELNYSHTSGFFSSLEVISVDDMVVNNSNAATSDSYVVSNLRLGYKIRRGSWELSPFAGVNNIFDEDYFGNVRINAFGSRFFEPAPLRNVYGGLGIRYDF